MKIWGRLNDDEASVETASAESRKRSGSWKWLTIDLNQPRSGRSHSVDFSLDGAPRYEIREQLGKGSFGEVCLATDMETSQSVAIKRIANAFGSYETAKRTLRECRLVRLLDKHDNLVEIRNILPLSRNDPSAVYIIFEAMDTDLDRIISSDQTLTEEHVKFFIFQVLLAVHFLHTAGICHRDLKPRNLLVNRDCSLKVCDFGLARLCTPDLVVDGGMTDYVATRWYRAPEVFGGRSSRPLALDMWAVGCILGELKARKPLFPGRDAVHSIELIFNTIGHPSTALLRRMFPGQENVELRNSVTFRGNDDQSWGKDLLKARLGSDLDDDLAGLIRGLCHLDPRERYNSFRALEDPYVAELVDDHLAHGQTLRTGNAIDPRAFEFDDDIWRWRDTDGPALGERIDVDNKLFSKDILQEIKKYQKVPVLDNTSEVFLSNKTEWRAANSARHPRDT